MCKTWSLGCGSWFPGAGYNIANGTSSRINFLARSDFQSPRCMRVPSNACIVTCKLWCRFSQYPAPRRQAKRRTSMSCHYTYPGCWTINIKFSWGRCARTGRSPTAKITLSEKTSRISSATSTSAHQKCSTTHRVRRRSKICCAEWEFWAMDYHSQDFDNVWLNDISWKSEFLLEISQTWNKYQSSLTKFADNQHDIRYNNDVTFVDVIATGDIGYWRIRNL